MNNPLRALLPCVALAFSFALAGCNPTVTGCEAPDGGGAELPDPSFEESPTQWTLAGHSVIDDEKGVCNGSRSLRVQLDSGIGSTEVTRSPSFTGLKLGEEYEIRFQYRWENCKNALLWVKTGNYEKRLEFEGLGGSWEDTRFTVVFEAEPVFIDIYPARDGAAGDFQGGEYDNNLMWVDDFTLEDLSTSE